MIFSAETSELPRQRRRVGPGTVVLIAATVVMILLALAFCGAQYLVGQQVMGELAKIRAAGEPITAADLEAFYSRPPDGRNATALWMAAAEMLASPACQTDARDLPWLGVWPNPPTMHDAPWPQQGTAERFLHKCAGPLKDIHAAAALGGTARYPTQFSDGIGMTLQAQQNLRFVSSLLDVEYEVAIHHGDARVACESVHTMFALARSLEREPLLVSQLLRLGKNDMALGHFQRLMMIFDLSESDLAQIDSDLAGIDYYDGFRQSMLGERVIGMETFAHPMVLGERAPTAVASLVFGQADLAVYLQLMDELLKASAAKNHQGLRDAAEQGHQDITRARANWRYYITKQLLPSLQAFTDAIGRGTARRDVARMAIAVERYRRANGHCPTSLDELVPDFATEVPVDPFSGVALKLRVSDEGCRVYSVGPDGVDQGGSVDEAGSAGDIVFRVPKRAANDDATSKE
jgi:hypothetical protein